MIDENGALCVGIARKCRNDHDDEAGHPEAVGTCSPDLVDAPLMGFPADVKWFQHSYKREVSTCSLDRRSVSRRDLLGLSWLRLHASTGVPANVNDCVSL